MNKVPIQERIRLIQCYYGNGQSVLQTLRAYRVLYGVRPCSRQAVKALVTKFEMTGSVQDAKRSGRPSVNDDSVIEVLADNREQAETSQLHTSSCREISRRTDIPLTTVWRILTFKLKLYPYKIQKVHAITAGDRDVRYHFSLRCVALIGVDPNWLFNVLWTDEAHFSLNGYVNTKNSVIWADGNPHQVFPQPLHSPKVTVWCAFNGYFILGPYFFEELDRHGRLQSVTVTGVRYHALLVIF